jgi:hypothetical protein
VEGRRAGQLAEPQAWCSQSAQGRSEELLREWTDAEHASFDLSSALAKGRAVLASRIAEPKPALDPIEHLEDEIEDPLDVGDLQQPEPAEHAETEEDG